MLTFVVVGCTSTVGAPERTAGLARFLAEPAPELLAYRRSLRVDESLVAMRQEGTVAKLKDAFASDEEVYSLLGGIRDAAPSLGKGVVRFVTEAASADAGHAAEAPVLFVWPTWQVSYQRLPPRLDLVRLELGVIAKVIPRRQVMQGLGNLALRTAYWESHCHTYALDGAFFSVSQWLADNAARWREALAEVGEACSRKIGHDFEKSTARADQ